MKNLQNDTLKDRTFFVAPLTKDTAVVRRLYLDILNHQGKIELTKAEIALVVLDRVDNVDQIYDALYEIRKKFKWVIIFVTNIKPKQLTKLYELADDVFTTDPLKGDFIEFLIDSLKGYK